MIGRKSHSSHGTLAGLQRAGFASALAELACLSSVGAEMPIYGWRGRPAEAGRAIAEAI